jgi:hypothetical protein
MSATDSPPAWYHGEVLFSAVVLIETCAWCSWGFSPSYRVQFHPDEGLAMRRLEMTYLARGSFPAFARSRILSA